MLPATLALTATLGWGMSDFLGGYAARRANAFLLTTITHLSGTLFVSRWRSSIARLRSETWD